MKKEELIKKYMNNELCIKRNGASDRECEIVSAYIGSNYGYSDIKEYEWYDDFSRHYSPEGMQVITVQEFLKACEESDKEENYSHLIGKEVEVRDSDSHKWKPRTFVGVLKSRDCKPHYFVQSTSQDSVVVEYLQMREKQETIHLEKGYYTKEELETELNKFKNK